MSVEAPPASQDSSAVWRACVPRTPWRAIAWYSVLTVAMTWPLATMVASYLPKDLGDPLLNCWILAWNADHFQRALSGDVAGLTGLWHGNIFHPEPFTLAYSELLIAQSLLGLPVWIATKNIVLVYNLLFLSTFALSGLGMFLLVRQTVGDWRVAFVAGLLFAFIPYRSHQASHIQVMTSQWMPFALYGFSRAVSTRGMPPLFWGAVALLAQNLSCGYFMVFFSMFVPPFVLVEMARHRRVTDMGLWARFGIAAGLVGLATWPFMHPYLALRELHDTRRSIAELAGFSADTWSWLTAESNSTFWSRWLQPIERPEGSLFPGVLPILLAFVAALGGAFRIAATGSNQHDTTRRGEARWRPFLRTGAWVLTAWALVTTLLLVAGGGGLYRVGDFRIRIQSLTRSLELLALGGLILMTLSSRFRTAVLRTARSPLAFALFAAGFSAYLSLGPVPRAGGGEMNGPPIYLWLYHTVPGFDGLRVPARFAAVGGLFLILAGSYGLRDVLRKWPRAASAWATACCLFWLLESNVLPFPVAVNVSADTPAVQAPPSRLPVGRVVPPSASIIRLLPEAAVLLQLPLGDISWELQYVYGSIFHWRPMVNGYSGYAPRSYLELLDVLRDPTRSPQRAWARLMATDVTHIVVHRGAYRDARPPSPYAWLAEHGAVLKHAGGGVDVFLLPR